MHAEGLVDVALAQVAVDQHDALAGLGEHGAEVLADEALADAGRGAGDEHRALLGAEQGEVQRGAQAAQALHGVVVGVGEREELALVGLAAGDGAREHGFFLAGGHGGVHRQRELALDGLRVFDDHAQAADGPHQAERAEHAEHAREQQDERLARGDRQRRGGGGVDHAHVADGAGAGHAQLLGAVEQVGVERGGDLDVAAQAQRGLLGVGEAVDVLVEGAAHGAQAAELGVDGLDLGVLGGEALAQLVALLLEDDDVVVDLDDGAEDRLGLEW